MLPGEVEAHYLMALQLPLSFWSLDGGQIFRRHSAQTEYGIDNNCLTSHAFSCILPSS